MVMGIFFTPTLPLWCGIIFPNSLATPPLWYLINFLVDGSLLSTNFSSYAQRSITNFSEALPSPRKLGDVVVLSWDLLQLFFVFRNQVSYPL